MTGVMGHPGVADGDRRQRVVPAGRHPTVGDRARRTGRRAGVGADLLDRVGGAVRAVHPRPYRGPARLADAADAGVERQRPADPPAGAGPGAEDRVATAAARRPGGALPRGDGGAGCRAARRRRHHRRRRKHRRLGDPLPARPPRRAVHRRAGHGRHGIQLRRRRGCGVRAPAADRGHRGRRLILHARHGDSHRVAVPPAGDVPAVRQPCACDVRDPRTTVLRAISTATTDSAQAGWARAWRPCSPVLASVDVD